jgi:RHS repeat-associated protein
MVMPNRKTPAAGNSTYRYGFNGKENDDEAYGDDNEQDYGMRIYDPRLGRFLSVDPIAREYPELTPYQFAGNMPIWAVDLDGLEPWKVNTLDGGKTDFNGPYPDQKSAQINYDNSIDPASVTPRDEYEAAILSKAKKIVYTENYGWVDRTHAFTNTKREDWLIGFNKLWDRIKKEEGGNDHFFTTSYRQDILKWGTSIGITEKYDIKKGLSLPEKQQVALALLQDVSIKFERLQGLHPTSGSSFEPADLPSNMLNFYSNAFGWSPKYIESLIKPLGPVSSLMVYRMYPGTFTEKKNYSFSPMYFNTVYTPSPYKIPPELQRVNPAQILPAARSMSERHSNLNFKIRRLE